MNVDAVALSLKSLWMQFIHFFWELSLKQAKRILQIGINLWMDHFQMNIWKAIEKVIDPLEGMDAWDVVESNDDMNAMNRTLAFKWKYLPKVLWRSSKPALVLMGINS